MKKIFLVTLLFLIAFFAFGEGEQEKAGTTGGVVEFWHGFQSGRMGDAMKNAVAEFEKRNPEITVNQTLVAWDKIADKTLTAVAAGNPPDVFRGWAWIVPAWGPEGALTSLDDYIDRDRDEWDPDDFWQVTMNQSMWDGEVMGISPSTIANSVLFYNKERFQKVGLDPNKPPVTIDQYNEYAGKLTTKEDGKITAFGGIPWLVRKDVLHWGYSMYGKKVWDPAAKEISIDDPAYEDVLTWYDNFAEKYGREEIQKWVQASESGQFGRWNPEGPFYTGQVSLWISGQWYYNDIKEYAPDLDFGMVGMPGYKGKGNPGSTLVMSNFFFMPKGAQNPDNGWELMKFLSGEYYMNTLVKKDAVTPSRKSVAFSSEFEEGADWVKITRELIQEGYAFPPMPGSSKFIDLVEQGVDDVVYDVREPDEVLDDIQSTMEREIKRLLKK